MLFFGNDPKETTLKSISGTLVYFYPTVGMLKMMKFITTKVKDSIIVKQKPSLVKKRYSCLFNENASFTTIYGD